MKNSTIKSIIIIIFITIVISFDSIPNSQSATTIRVGAYDNEPKIYTNDEGEIIGFFPQIIEYIAKKEGWNIEYVSGTWSECLERLENNEIDIMVDVAYSEERAELYDFNEVPLFQNWGIIYSRVGIQIESLTELEGRTVAVMQNSIHTVGIKGIKNLTEQFSIDCTFIEYADYTSVFESIDNGTADTGVVNRLFGLLNEKDYDIIQSSVFFNPVDLKFAFPKDAPLNQELISRIDYQLIIMKDDPDSTYYDALEKYFLQSSIEVIPQWLIYTLIIIIFFTLMFSFTSMLLKRNVDKKTRELQNINIELKEDIEKRQAIEYALRVSEESLEIVNEILIDTIQNGVLLLDQSWNVLIINEKFKELFINIYHKNLAVFDSIQNIENNLLVESIKSIVRSKEIDEDIQESIIKNKPNSAGEKRSIIKSKIVSIEEGVHLELYYSKLKSFGSEGNFAHLFIINDITPFIEIEEMRKKLISTVSHELRTPIASINLTLENLDKFGEKISIENKEYMMKILRENSKILSQMIEDLLISSRIQNKKINLDFSKINANSMINNIIEQLTSKKIEKNITISNKINEEITFIGDYKRIEQAFRIFIDNAIKYSPSDSTITIEAEDNFTSESFKDPYVLIKVIDQGYGIPEKEMSKLFSQFFRASNVRELPGTGLGLNIAQELIKLHNGSITVDSELGKGSIFSVYIPKNLEL